MHKIITVIIATGLLTIASPTIARTYDIYVDKDNLTGIENGTQVSPYNTIQEGLDAVLLNDKDNRNVYVANGEYAEQIELGKYVKLYGEDKNKVVINGDSKSYTVKMNDHTKIEDVTIYKGKRGITVVENAKADIDNVKIKKFKKIGVEILKSNRNNSEKVTIEDSKIYKGKGKGIYIKKGKVEIIDNKIYDNDEEGIDIRSRVSGTINNNKIYDNDESGIEMILGKSKLHIKNNSLKNNKSNGLTLQYYKKYGESSSIGKVKITKNSFRRNKKYGLGCNAPSNKLPYSQYWKDSTTITSSRFIKNHLGKYELTCGLK